MQLLSDSERDRAALSFPIAANKKQVAFARLARRDDFFDVRALARDFHVRAERDDFDFLLVAGTVSLKRRFRSPIRRVAGVKALVQNAALRSEQTAIHRREKIDVAGMRAGDRGCGGVVKKNNR